MRPDIDGLIAAVRWTIQEALLPEVASPYARFQALIAVDLLDLIHRAWPTDAQDLAADAHDLLAGLAAARPAVERSRDPHLDRALAEALADPPPPIPVPRADLEARTHGLAELADRVLAALETSSDPPALTAAATVRAALRAVADRGYARQADLEIRR